LIKREFMEPEGIEQEIGLLLKSAGPREKKARLVTHLIRSWREYRWVGVYDVSPESVSIIAWSGPGAPAFPTFPVSKGLTSRAIREKRTVCVGDVRNDPNYLTAFCTTLSEAIIPVLDPRREQVLGTIDVESEKRNAFSELDLEALEEFARAALPLWTGADTQ
jgi:putative methionine-R-sulfoxide reductase with GAF domain